MSREAHIATAAFAAVRGSLPMTLASAASGRELIDAGFAQDVDLAAELDVTTLGPVLHQGSFRVL